MIDLRFFQAAATAIPTLLIAIGFAAALLTADSRRSVREQQGLLGRWGRWYALGGLTFVIVAEIWALVTIAAARPTVAAFVVVLAAVVFLLSSLASMAVHELMAPLSGTWLSGLEVFVFFVVSIWSALVLSLWLIS